MAKKVTVEKAAISDAKKKVELSKPVLPKPAAMTANNKFGANLDIKSPAISVVSGRQEFEKKVEASPAVIVKTETGKDGRILVKEPASTAAYDEVKKVLSQARINLTQANNSPSMKLNQIRKGSMQTRLDVTAQTPDKIEL